MTRDKYHKHVKDKGRDILKDLADLPRLSEDDPIFKVTGGGSLLNLLNRRKKQQLHPREAQFVFLLSHGWDYDKIATELHLSYNTVRSQVQRARAVLQANNNEHLIGLALRAGLID